MQIILASSSPRRQDLLEDAGIRFLIDPPNIEEWSEESHPDMPAVDLARSNARRKGEDVAQRYPDSIVLSADTIVYCDGRILGKPLTQTEAKEMLTFLSGRTHEVLTAVSWIDSAEEKIREYVCRTWVTFKELTPEMIEAYITNVHVMDKAGAYALQDRGEDIVERVEGSRSNVIGLPIEIISDWWDELLSAPPN